MKPIRIVQITDTHIMAEGDAWFGRTQTDTQGRLQGVIHHINASTPKPDFVIHTGDITENGDVESYVHAKKLLDHLTVPYFLTCGNHDNFDNLKAVFKDQPFQGKKFSHYVLNGPTLKVLILDSHVLGKDHGLLCEERKDWLNNQLKEDSRKPTLIFLHHFPINVQDSLFSKIKLENAHDLEKIILENPQIKGIYCGHYHHAIASVFKGTMCWVSPSTAPCHILNEEDCTGLSLTYASYSLHEIKGEAITSKIISVAPILSRWESV